MSTETSTGSAAEDEVLVGRCYTKARRHPLMIGKWPGGRRPIWGGPYTVPQVIVIAVVFAVLMLTRGVWAHFGLVNFVIAIGVPYVLSLVVRHVHIDGRNPLLVAMSAAGAAVAPAGGRLGGRPVKSLGRYRPLVGVCSLTWTRTSAGPSDQAEGRRESRRSGAAPRQDARMVEEQVNSAAAQSSAGEVASSSSGTVGGRPVAVAAGLLALRQERARIREVRTDGRGV
ncbi:hypothetical protein [Streptomyces sp. NPDC057426]|uniref:hypothetical protein n=1 Tax=Streptomyces sp. NPDC057426 TaxID=3346128 RepID=UPI0036870C7B